MSAYHRALLLEQQRTVRKLFRKHWSWSRCAIYAADSRRRAHSLFGGRGGVLPVECLKPGYVGPLRGIVKVQPPVRCDLKRRQ